MTTLQIILLIIAVEAPNCKCPGDFCYCTGDNGKAIGICMIHKIYVDDINRIYNLQYRWEDAYHKATAMLMTRLYLSHYVTEERIGRPVTVEDHVRCHNGGGSGWKKDCTLKHWAKAERLLNAK